MATDSCETPQGSHALLFDPDKYPHCALKAFHDFTEQYSFRYHAQYPYPPKHVIDKNAEWKSENEDREPTVVEEKIIREAWTSIDKTLKLLGFFASPRLLQDWKAAKGAEIEPTSDTFLTLMQAYYKPTENHIIRNYEFRQLTQKSGETFSAFCNRVEAAAKNCRFCDCAETTACTITAFATHDQIVIGTNNEGICEKAMMKDWSLQDLRKKGMKHRVQLLAKKLSVELHL